ncbi:serine/threonine-protein kinase [Klenkia terrae]|jgi:serine/threonine-protein kinase|uniref:non-specific serine/threonine protein kinase n=1 Tax=Klenkia terrae TaxID=1052259 RepID=A0ABU8E8A5_9ACTN|nr:serine/threonine-protein kinase [Klenkia terrae]SSC23667.1 Protein kinase [Klenkia terrae]
MALHIGSILAGRYEITAPIATGGMGEVWQATDRTLGRTVAAKVLKSEYTGDKNFLERFRNEARHTAGLTHANIASVYDYGETQDDDGRTLAFLVMEYVEGEPLVAILDREITLSPERTLDVLAQAGEGLSAAHRAGVVHRDIKPGNLMVRPDGVVKLTDFGIAWARDAAPLTRTGMVVGTAQYLSPEQAQGFQVTAASDVYSLGVLGYECLAGNRPFDGDSQVAIALAQINRPPPPLPAAVPAPVRALVEKALSKDPAARFPDGGAFAAAARRIAAGGPGPDTSAATAFIPAVGGGSTQLIGGGAAAAAAVSASDTAPRTMPPLQGPPVDEETDGWDDDEPRRRSPWPWVAAAAVLLLVLGAVLAFTLLSDSGDDDGSPSTTTTPATTTSAPPATSAPSTTAAETTAEETTAGEEEPTEEPGEETTQAPPPATTTQAPTTTRTTTTQAPPPVTTTPPTTATTTTESSVAEGQPVP